MLGEGAEFRTSVALRRVSLFLKEVVVVVAAVVRGGGSQKVRSYHDIMSKSAYCMK